MKDANIDLTNIGKMPGTMQEHVSAVNFAR